VEGDGSSAAGEDSLFSALPFTLLPAEPVQLGIQKPLRNPEIRFLDAGERIAEIKQSAFATSQPPDPLPRGILCPQVSGFVIFAFFVVK